MTNRSSVSKEVTNPSDEGFWDMLERTAPKESKYKTGSGMDFPLPGTDPDPKYKRKRKKRQRKGIKVYKGGKIMVGYKAGGKV